MSRKERWTFASLAVLSGFLGGFVAGWAGHGVGAFAATRHLRVARVVNAHDFVLLDAKGAKRAQLHMAADDQPNLVFYGPEGRTRAILGVSAKGMARIRLFDEKGDPGAALGDMASGRSGMVLLSSKRKVRASFEVNEEGFPTLRLLGNSGRPRVGISVTNGHPGVVLLDETGKTRAALAENDQGQAGLAIYDANGTAIAGLPLAQQAKAR